MFVVLIHYKQPITEVEKHLASHRAYLGECYKKDYFIASGPQNPRTGGVILSQLSDKNQLQEVIHQDPFHINGVADFEIIEFDPVKYHPNFSVFINNK